MLLFDTVNAAEATESLDVGKFIVLDCNAVPADCKLILLPSPSYTNIPGIDTALVCGGGKYIRILLTFAIYLLGITKNPSFICFISFIL